MIATPATTKAVTIIRQALLDGYTPFELVTLGVEENFGAGTATIHVTLRVGERPVSLSGRGNGPVDAVVKAFKGSFGGENPSLKTIHVHSYSSRDVPNSSTPAGAGSDAQAQATVTFSTSQGERVIVTAQATSINRAGLLAVVEAFEFFLNAERAYRVLHKALDNARDRDRQDLSQEYIAKLAELVRWFNYEGLIPRSR